MDWYDNRRAFVVTSDSVGTYDPTNSLRLHLIYDGRVVDSIGLRGGFSAFGDDVYQMAFDPYSRRLYVGEGEFIHVVAVNYGADPAVPGPFVGLNYESGALSSAFTLFGDSFPPSTSINIHANDHLLGSTTTDAQGQFRLLLKTASADPGAYSIKATAGSQLVSAARALRHPKSAAWRESVPWRAEART